jgi:hypothetical protein
MNLFYTYPPSAIPIPRLWLQGMLNKSIRELGFQTLIYFTERWPGLNGGGRKGRKEVQIESKKD